MASADGGWATRYPDLHGKAMIVTGDDGGGDAVIGVTRALAANGALLAIVSADRAVVDTARVIAETSDTAVFAITADAADAGVWTRLGAHIEQRLGPIDVIVAIAGPATRVAVRAALEPDMTARARGVIIEVDATASPSVTAAGVRHRAVRDVGGNPADIAAAVLLCASDTVSASPLLVVAGQPKG